MTFKLYSKHQNWCHLCQTWQFFQLSVSALTSRLEGTLPEYVTREEQKRKELVLDCQHIWIWTQLIFLIKLREGLISAKSDTCFSYWFALLIQWSDEARDTYSTVQERKNKVFALEYRNIKHPIGMKPFFYFVN